KTGADSDANQEEDEAEEEEEARSLEFLQDDEEEDDALISTQSSSASVSSILSHVDPSPQGAAGGTGCCAIGIPVQFQADESCESERKGGGGSAQYGGEGLVSFDYDQGRIDGDEQEGGGTAGGLAPAMEVVDMQKEDSAAQQDYIFDYSDSSTSAQSDDGVDIIVPHAPFLPVLSPTTLRPQRLCKVPVVSEYVDPFCPPTPPPPPPLSLAASASSSSSDKASITAAVPADTDDMNMNVMMAHDHNRQEEEYAKESLNKTNNVALEVSPLHQLDHPPHPPHPQQQQQQQPYHTIAENPSVPSLSSTPQQQQRQPDRNRWRLSANYLPTRRRGERSAVTASGILTTTTSAGATHSIYGDITTSDSTSIRSSMIAPTTFVMIDTDGNQILTDPYTSSVTPPLPSPFSTAIMGGGSSGSYGKALPAPVPLWLTAAVPQYHFSSNSGSGSGSSNGASAVTSGVISPTADPQVAAHIAEALRMYGIPSLHQPATIHPFQRSSMIPTPPSRSTSMGTPTTAGSTARAVAAASSVASGSGGSCGDNGNEEGGPRDRDGNGDDEGEGEEEEGQQRQQQARSILHNADADPDDKDQAAAGEPSALQKFLKALMCGC
ncbi:hypothetical protein BGZ47_008963, partial [Haplosporangium gracile]